MHTISVPSCNAMFFYHDKRTGKYMNLNNSTAFLILWFARSFKTVALMEGRMSVVSTIIDMLLCFSGLYCFTGDRGTKRKSHAHLKEARCKRYIFWGKTPNLYFLHCDVIIKGEWRDEQKHTGGKKIQQNQTGKPKHKLYSFITRCNTGYMGTGAYLA